MDDPRLEPAAREVEKRLGAHLGGKPTATVCPECMTIARLAIAAADAVDPLRNPKVNTHYSEDTKR